MWKRLVGPYPLMTPGMGQAMVLAFAISASAAFALSVLFLWHCYLILTAQVRSPQSFMKSGHICVCPVTLCLLLTDLPSPSLKSEGHKALVQCTIDFLNNWNIKRLLAKEGQRWHNPHDQGVVANWKVRHAEASKSKHTHMLVV